MNLRDTYNRIAKDWHQDHKQDDWWVEGTDRFISLLVPGAEVLDVGCGGGVKAKYLSDRGLRVTGIDFSEGLIEIAKQEAPEAEFQVMDMIDADTLSKQFDAVFAQASLLHIPKAKIGDVLKKLTSGLLKQRGYIYIAVKGARPGGPEEEIKKEDDYGYPYERFFSYFTLEELKRLFQDAGLEITYEDVHTTGKTDWLQVIGKKT